MDITGTLQYRYCIILETNFFCLDVSFMTSLLQLLLRQNSARLYCAIKCHRKRYPIYCLKPCSQNLAVQVMCWKNRIKIGISHFFCSTLPRYGITKVLTVVLARQWRTTLIVHLTSLSSGTPLCQYLRTNIHEHFKMLFWSYEKQTLRYWRFTLFLNRSSGNREAEFQHFSAAFIKRNGFITYGKFWLQRFGANAGKT